MKFTGNNSGFTLLEVMIAMAIMLVAFASILMVESASLNTSAKSKQMNVVAMLAKNEMVQAENEFTGKKFDEIKKEQSGSCPEPYKEYTCSRVIKEVELPNLSLSGSGNGSGTGDTSTDNNSSNTQIQETMTKLVTKYLSKAVREVTVTISWKKGTGEQKYSISTYWVDLNSDFSLSE